MVLTGLVQETAGIASAVQVWKHWENFALVWGGLYLSLGFF